MRKRRLEVSGGHGSVYEHLGYRNAEDMALKAQFVVAITKAIKARGLKTQGEAARVLGVSQPKVSRLLSGHFREYSVERLMRFLVLLGHDVEIKVRKARNPDVHVEASVR